MKTAAEGTGLPQEQNELLAPAVLAAVVKSSNASLISSKLAMAIIEKDLEAIRFLLDNKADLTVPISAGDPDTPLDFAVVENNAGVNRLLESYCARDRNLMALWESKKAALAARANTPAGSAGSNNSSNAAQNSPATFSGRLFNQPPAADGVPQPTQNNTQRSPCCTLL